MHVRTVLPLMVLLAQLDTVPLAAQHRPHQAPRYGTLPALFVENQGQWPREVAFALEGGDKTIYFTATRVVLALASNHKRSVVHLDFLGSSGVTPRGELRQPTIVSYFKGDPTNWKTGTASFRRLVYENLWPGIDLVYVGSGDTLKYYFVVRPGTDPNTIRLAYSGVRDVVVTQEGRLRVRTPLAEFHDQKPVAHQIVHNQEVPVRVAYALDSTSVDGKYGWGFSVTNYDRRRDLIIDPAIVVYSGYIGGAANEQGTGIKVDSQGCAYVTGLTSSSEASFPTKVGPDTTFNGALDVFVGKLDPSGTNFVYIGFIGGAADERADDIAIDGNGNAYVTGRTSSSQNTFPVKVGPDLTYNGGASDAFIAKVDPTGKSLVYCGYLGGTGVDYGHGIDVDRSGSAYITGWTGSNESSFPVSVGPDLTYNGGALDAFVAKVNPNGGSLAYCGYVGGVSQEAAGAIAVDGQGAAYLTGWTYSTESTFPVRVGPDLTYNGGGTWVGDAFVAKLHPNGSGLIYCGYIGGASGEQGAGIAVDGLGHAYVCGLARSTESSFPVVVGPDLTHNGGDDAFVAKVDPGGVSLLFSGFIGGGGNDAAWDLALDASGDVFLAGVTGSFESSFPVTIGPDLTFNGQVDAFVAKLSSTGSSLTYCGYVGGAGNDTGLDVASDDSGNAYSIGWTTSPASTFPAKAGPGLVHKGGDDAFVAKIAFVLLRASASASPGGSVPLLLTASDSVGLPYQLGSSLGTGPIRIGNRSIGLSPDNLLAVSVAGAWPTVFASYAGIVANKGQAVGKINLPNLPALIGNSIHTAFVTISPSAPWGVRSISNTVTVAVVP